MAANPLDIRTVIGVTQQALVDTIDLAYRQRLPPVADLAALASAYLGDPAGDESVAVLDRSLCYVQSEGVVYRWRSASTLPPVSPYVIAPAVFPSLSAGNGRWLRESSSVTLGPAYYRPLHRVPTGYARAVEIYEGLEDEQLERIYAVRPAFLVEWVSDRLKVQGYAHGTIYDYVLDYKVHCLSQNYRPGPAALLPPEVPGDEDPGLYRMLGDIRYLLGGCQLGLAPGVKFVDVQGSARIVEKDLSQRVFRAELDVVVKGSVHVVDEDLFQNPQVWVERRDAGTPAGQNFDASNHVALGYKFSPQRGLAAAPSAGVAYIAGQLVTSTPGVHTFTADADTYRDLDAQGQLTYQAVDIGADPPPQMPGTLRVGLTRTGAASIDSDVYLCSYSVPSGADPGDPFRAA